MFKQWISTAPFLLYVFNDRQRKVLRKSFENEKYKVIFDVGCMAGLREKEIITLNHVRGDLDFRNSLIKVSEGAKYNKNREVPMHPQLKRILKSYVQQNKKHFRKGYIFIPEQGRYRRKAHLEPSSVQKAFDKAFDKTPYKCYYKRCLRGVRRHWTFETSRHYFASKCINTNCNIEELSKIMGHNSVLTTVMTYGHLFKTERKAKQDIIKKIKF